MQFTYELDYLIYGPTRKNQALIANKGHIDQPSGSLTVEAKNDLQAFDKVRKFFRELNPGDRRPVAGASYLRFAREKHWRRTA